MRGTTLAILLALLIAYFPASARIDNAGFATFQDVQAVQTDYLGSYTLAGGLPDPVANSGKRILVNDLGGGPGYLRATSGCWKRVSTTVSYIQTVAVNTTVSLDGLLSSPIVGLTGSAFAGKATISVTNACSMPQMTVVAPAGVFGALGSLGISVNAGQPVTVAGVGVAGTWTDYSVSPDGSALTKIRGGSL